MSIKKAAAAITLDFDGVKVTAWSEDSGEVHVTVDDNEEIHLSPITAIILGHALLQLAKPVED
jgi:hypothetical protein